MSLNRLRIGHALWLACLSGVAAAAPSARTYIVQFNSPPAASYDGSIPGLAATRVAPGAQLDARQASVKAYRAHLRGERQKALASLGAGVKVLHQYDLVLNGVAVKLTEAQARQLKANRLVRAVVPDEARQALTVSTPKFLGLDAPGGLWSQKINRQKIQGEDIIVAVIDSGVQPENPAFYDQVNDKGVPVRSGGTLAYGPPPAKWSGACTTGPGFAADSCNNKLIGAKVFSAGFLAQSPANAFAYNFYDVPRDEGGHGTHTLSTAGGNAKAPAYTSGGAYIGATSGIAPRARLASYKALFGVIQDGSLSGSGYNSDLVAAIDAAVEDGVDVLNYSISGSKTNLLDPVEVAFLNASFAGVFVAASAGNSGPGNEVAHPSPWITTVAASTHDRVMVADLKLGDGGLYTGASFNGRALGSAPMVLSVDVAAAGASITSANLCFLGSLDPVKAAGKIVVCDRGTNARTDKSAEVQRVGGVGMVLINPTPNNVVADFHSVPTVHLPNTTRDAIRGYVAAGSGTGGIGKARQSTGAVAPVMASFSSRGPNLADSHVMKPDITAPGVDIIASVAYTQGSQAEHDAILDGSMVPSPVVESLQGTSMSSPHVAGLAALLKQAQPGWSPAAIKSALMTTAGPVRQADGSVDGNRHGYGAGHVNPNGAVDPGLVYDIEPVDYYRYLCGAGWLPSSHVLCMMWEPLDPNALNLPSLTAEVVSTTTLKRSVTNVGKTTATYTASISLPGYEATVTPSTLTLGKGKTGDFTVKLRKTSAPLGAPVFGSLSWSDGVHQVVSPISARGLAVAAPAFFTGDVVKGEVKFPVTYGFAGETRSVVAGMKPATVLPGVVAQGGFVCHDVSVPSGGLALRAALYDSDTSGAGADDLDLYLLDASGTVILAQSAGASSQEAVTLSLPAAGNYLACIDGYAPAGGSANYKLSTWVLGESDTSRTLSATGLPTTVAVGDKARVGLAWRGLRDGQRYLGGVRYDQPDGTAAGVTLLAVEPGAASTVLRQGDVMAHKTARLKALRAR